MSSEIDILIKATDEASGTVKTATVSIADYNAALEKMIAAEKNAIVSTDITAKFESMTEAEKDAFLATQELARAQGKLAQSEALANEQREKSESMTNRMSQASQLATNVVNSLQQAYQAYNQAVEATVGTQAEYANEVRSLNELNGQSAEANSRLIQVLDDHKVSLQDLMSTQREMSKDGKTLTIDTIASIAEEYNKATSQVDKNKIAQDGLGKSWKSYVELLKLGADGIREESAAVSESMILTQARIDASREWEMSTDRVADATQGLLMTLGGGTSIVTEFNNAWAAGIEGWTRFVAGVGGAIDAQTRENEIMEHTRAILAEQNANFPQTFENQNRWIAAHKETTEAARAMATEELNAADATKQVTQANQEYTPSAEEVAAADKEIADAAKAVSDANIAMIGTINSIQSADESYAKSSTDLAKQQEEAEGKLAALRTQGYAETGMEIQEQIGKVDEIKNKEAELAAARDQQTLQFISNLLLQKLEMDGLTTAEFEAFTKQQEAWGLWSADAVAKAQAAWSEADKVAASISSIPKETTSNINLVTNHIDNYGMGNTPPGDPLHAHAAGTGPGGAEGGLTWVGETGRELINLPPKAQVTNSPTARAMTEGGGAKTPAIDYERLGSVLARAVVSAMARAG